MNDDRIVECVRCHEVRPMAILRRSAEAGRTAYRPWCKPCESERVKSRYHARNPDAAYMVRVPASQYREGMGW